MTACSTHPRPGSQDVLHADACHDFARTVLGGEMTIRARRAIGGAVVSHTPVHCFIPYREPPQSHNLNFTVLTHEVPVDPAV